MFADDPAYAEKAARVAALAKDASEYLLDLDLASPAPRGESSPIIPPARCSTGRRSSTRRRRC